MKPRYLLESVNQCAQNTVGCHSSDSNGQNNKTRKRRCKCHFGVAEHRSAQPSPPTDPNILSSVLIPEVFKVKADDSFGRARGTWHSLAKV